MVPFSFCKKLLNGARYNPIMHVSAQATFIGGGGGGLRYIGSEICENLPSKWCILGHLRVKRWHMTYDRYFYIHQSMQNNFGPSPYILRLNVRQKTGHVRRVWHILHSLISLGHFGAKASNNEATWRWCEPTCQYHDVYADPDPCNFWPWPMWPLNLIHVTFHHDYISRNTQMRPENKFFLTWWSWPLTYDHDFQGRPFDHQRPCSDQISWS